MRRPSFLAASVMTVLVLSSAAAREATIENAPTTFGGRYRADGDATRTLTITHLSGGVHRVVGDDWEGAGLFDGTSYWGVFRRGQQARPPELAGASGTHRSLLRPDGSLAVHGEFAAGRTGSFETVWTPERMAIPPALPIPRFEPPVRPREAPPGPNGSPNVGEYFIPELPEVVTKVPPDHPQAAREAKIQGTVIVQTLVGEDGRVRDTRVGKSIPGLDEAAVSCVRKWVFKPARGGGKPVAVWVAVPVKFSRH